MKGAWKTGVFLLLLAAAVPAVQAAQAAGGQLGMSPAINEQQIEAFSKAQVRIDRINNQYQARLADGETDSIDDLNEQVASDMAQAIKDEGLTLAEYHRIAGAVIVDEDTRQRVIQRLQDLQQQETQAGDVSPGKGGPGTA